MVRVAQRTRKALIIGTVTIGLLGAGTAGTVLVKREMSRAESCERVQGLTAKYAEQRRAASDGSGPLLAVLGDSYTQGQWIDDPLQAFPYRTGDALGFRVVADGVGGSGYVNAGPCRDARLIDRVDSVLSKDPDVLVIAGGVNDLGSDGQAEAAAELFNHVQAKTDAKVYVLSPFAPPLVDKGQASEAASVLESAAKAHGFTFVDVRGWDFEVLPDRVHPTVKGHAVIGQDLAKAIR